MFKQYDSVQDFYRERAAAEIRRRMAEDRRVAVRRAVERLSSPDRRSGA